MKKNGHYEMAVLLVVKLSALLDDNIKKPRRVRGANAANYLNHFSDDMCVRKILLRLQVPKVRSSLQSPLAMKSKISCQYF